MKLSDTLERLVWTIVAAFCGTLGSTALLNVDVSTVEVAGVAAATAGVNYVSLVARHRLAVLPSPGHGLSRGS